MLISRLYGHMKAIRSTNSVPEVHLIRGESQSASQSLSTRKKLGDQQCYILTVFESSMEVKIWCLPCI